MDNFREIRVVKFSEKLNYMEKSFFNFKRGCSE